MTDKIPDEAVEAAVPRIAGFFDFRGLMLTNEAAAKLARLTLEAAAPYLTANDEPRP